MSDTPRTDAFILPASEANYARLLESHGNLERELAKLWEAADLVLVESNGIGDNEWRRPDGTILPEFPIASFFEALEKLEAAMGDESKQNSQEGK